jgi:gamma-glutamyltranspeptidase/glutathione hydrolase
MLHRTLPWGLQAKATRFGAAPVLAAAFAFALACSGPAPARPIAATSGTGATSSALEQRLPRPPAKMVEVYAVAAENSHAVEAARAVLSEGGSAADAAIAGILVGCAAHASSCGLGGGGAALVFDAANSRVRALDFRETAPVGLKRADHLGPPDSAKRGVAVGVPGLAAGLRALHELAGKLEWRRLLEIAALKLEGGLELSPYMAQALVWNQSWLANEPANQVLGPSNPSDSVGKKFFNAPLAKTLRTLGEEGERAFYEGPIAEEVVRAAKAYGSRLSLGDLKAYTVVERAPVMIDYGDFKVASMPPTSAGGVTMLAILSMLPPSQLAALEPGSGAFLHVVAEGLRATYAERATTIGDPDFTKGDFTALFDTKRMAERRASIDLMKTKMPRLPSVSDSGTFSLVVADAAGNVVSLSASLTGMFGSKIVTKYGFVLNDALSEFAMDDYGQRAFTRGPNFPRGRARPVSNLVPTIVTKNGRAVLGVSASGGLRGITGLTQVLLAHLGRAESLSEAVAKPRVHVNAGGALRLEEGLMELLPDLTSRGETVERSPISFSAVTGIAISTSEAGSAFTPVFDTRKGGAVSVEKAPANVTE